MEEKEEKEEKKNKDIINFEPNENEKDEKKENKKMEEENLNIIKNNNVKTINYGDLVIIYETGDSVKYFTLEKGKRFQNKFGVFLHDDIYGKNYGCKIYDNKEGKKYITILSFVPNIWERCINKMTQILFNPDISLIMILLNISQSSIIYESGTGSGCLSVNMSSVLSKGSGHLYTFEFNKERAEKLKDLFKFLNLDKKITITHRDVIQDGFMLDKSLANPSHKKCGSMFIDLPSPWLAIVHAKKVMKSGAYFISFSPCIEQVNQTMKAMKENNFIELRMFECLYRTFSFARTTQVKMPVIGKRKKGEKIEFKDVDINITKNKCDMRGHTGFLLLGINKE